MKKILHIVSIVLLLSVALFLRTYRITATQTFLEDEGRDALIVKRMVDTKRPVLLGPQTSTGNMYLGPLYYYLMTPPLILSRMDPAGPAVAIALTGVLTTYLLYVFGGVMFGKRVGYGSALLFALLPLPVALTRNSWNPNLMPLISVCMLYVVYKIAHKKDYRLRSFAAYGALVGTLVQLHYMALLFVGTTGITLLLSTWSSFKKNLLGYLVSGLTFILMLSPFLLFELRNNWVNTHAISRYVEAKEERNIRYDLPLWLWWDKVSKTTYRLVTGTLAGSSMGNQGKNVPASMIIFGAVLSIATLYSLRKRSSIYHIFVANLLGILAILGIYQESIHLHYLEFAVPLVILCLVGGIGQMQSRIVRTLAIIATCALVVVAFPQTLGYISSGPTHQTEKAQAVARYIVEKAEGKPYNLVSSPQTNTTPYQYYAYIGKNPPSDVAQDTVFMICQDEPCKDEEMNSPRIFMTGPAHPSLVAYIGHPLAAYVVEHYGVIANEHVAFGVWVAELVVQKKR